MKDEELKDGQQVQEQQLPGLQEQQTLEQVPAETADAKKKKEKKPPKKNKKAVGVFVKKYKLEKAEKKLFSRIYVEADREYARSLFVEAEDKKGRKFLAVPKDMRFTKKEVKRLKLISKDVKSQKGRVKIVALLITAALIAGVIIFISLFKDTLVKKAIKAGGEAAFGAACDVGDVSFRPLAGYLSIKDFEIADKGSPWRNVVQIDDITSDFDLTLLLQGKFIVEEMSVTGIQTGTARSYDGTLTPKEKKQKVKKEKVKKEKPEKEKKNAEPSKISLKVSEIADGMYSRFNSALSDLFAQYDPEKIIDGLYSQLTVPSVVNDAMEFGENLTDSLQQKVSELEETAGNVKDSIDSVMALDYQAALKNPLLIKDMYGVVENAVNTATDAYETATETVSYVQKVAKDVEEQYTVLSSAVGNDTDFLKGQVNVMKGISAGDAFNFLVDTGADLVQTVLGEAYGYIVTGLDYMKSLKKDEAKKEKKVPAERLPGRTITYRNHNEPKVWIKYLEGSGPKLQFTARNISSDEKAAGGPAVLDFNGHNLAFGMGSSTGPGLAATALFDLSATIHDTGDYAVEGKLDLVPFALHAGSFNPEIASEIVNSVFTRFNSVSAGFTAASAPDGMDFSFDTDIGSQLYNAVRAEWNMQLERVKEIILTELQDRLEGYVNEAVQSLTGYADLETAIAGYTDQIEGYRQLLEEKKTEFTEYINGTMDAIKDEVEKLKAEADRLMKEAEAVIGEKAEELKKQAAEMLAEADRLKSEAAQTLEQIDQMKNDTVNAVQDGMRNALDEAERAKAEAQAEMERLKKESEEAARAEVERLKKEAEEKAAAAVKAAEEAARAEAERLKKEAEEKAKKEAEEAAKKAAEAAVDKLKKFW